MSKRTDLTGQRFGRLTVVEISEIKDGNVFWLCRCDCGNMTVVTRRNLQSGNTRSCGCLLVENRGTGTITHGLSRTKIYRTWKDMRNRCHNPKRKSYPNYGGRGIAVCDEWRENFTAFYEHVSKLEHFGEDGYSLDRINNDGNYEPGNVRWANRAEQCRNKRNNVIVEYNGKRMTLSDAAKCSGIKIKTLQTRYSRGWRDEKLFQPVKH